MTSNGGKLPRKKFQVERQHKIATLVGQSGRVEIQQLAESFGVTTETIRRDLSDLELRGLVRKVHGGAVPWETHTVEPRVKKRALLNSDAKRSIGKCAIEYLPENGSILIDSGSTGAQFAKLIPADIDLTVITNSLQIAQILARHKRIKLVVLGGNVRKGTLAMVGAKVVAEVKDLSVDTTFISCDGFSYEKCLTTPSTTEAAVKEAMIAAARHVVALADSSKLDQLYLRSFAQWDQLDVFITDTIDPSVASKIETHRTSVVSSAQAVAT